MENFKSNKEELLRVFSAYLPYGLIGILEHKKEEVELTAIFCDKFNMPEVGINYSGSYALSRFKPILYPLEYLTKEIEHNGENFIPIVKWANLPIWANLKSCGYADKHYYVFFEIEGEIVKYKIPSDIESMNFYTVQKLLEWKLNVFNLPEDQFINKATLTNKQ